MEKLRLAVGESQHQSLFLERVRLAISVTCQNVDGHRHANSCNSPYSGANSFEMGKMKVDYE